jgi:hypothetical protein
MYQKRIRRKRLGQGVVELALVLPVILMLSTAAFDVARVRQYQSALTRAAQAGVDLGTKLGKDFESPGDEAIREAVRNSLLPPLHPSDIEDDDIVIERLDIAGQESVSVRINHEVDPFFINWPGFGGTGEASGSYPVAGAAVLPLQQFTSGSPAIAVDPAWTIEDDGTLVTTWDADCKITGSDFGSNDWIAPSYAWWQKKDEEGKLYNNNWTEFNDGNRVSREYTYQDPIEVRYEIEADTDNASHIVFMADSPNASLHHITSNDENQCRLYRDGDPAPMFEGSYSQGDVADFLRENIDPETNTIVLGENDVIVLWDFNQNTGTDSDLDWNDLVMVVTMIPEEN